MNARKIAILLSILLVIAVGIVVAGDYFNKQRRTIYICDKKGNGIEGVEVSILRLSGISDPVKTKTDRNGLARFTSGPVWKGGDEVSVKISRADEVLFDGCVTTPKMRPFRLSVRDSEVR